MSFVYEKAITKILNGSIDLTADDIRVLLVKVKASTTTDTETEVEFLSGFTTLGEIVATNYARAALVNEAVNEDLPNDRAEFDADNVTFSSIGGAANDTIGAAIIYKHVTNDADSIPIAYLDDAGSDFNITTNGSDVQLNFNVEGILQAVKA